jgi:hypothetical protein
MRSRVSGLVAIIAVLVAVVVVGVVLLSGASSGNGVAAKSPEAIFEAAETAAGGLKSVRVSVTLAGHPAGYVEIVAGKGAEGHIVYKGLDVQFIQLKNATYLKSTSLTSALASFGKTGARAAAELRGKWVRSSTGDDAGSVDGFPTNLRAFFSSQRASRVALTKTPTTTVAGRAVVGVVDKKAGWTLYVATTGKPYPIESTVTAGAPGSVIFHNFNAPVTLSAPAHPVNLPQLGP